jgi:glutathione S-transferase
MNQPKLKLVSFSMCSYVQRAIIAMQEKNIKYELEYIDLSMPPDWFFDVSPLEKVPVLLVDDQPLFESMAICEYIDDISGHGLYPEDPFIRAQHRAWIALGDSILGTVYDVIQTSDETEFKRARGTVIDRLDVVEEGLEADPFFAGQRFGMVDLAYAPLFQFLTGIARHSDIDFFEDVPGVKAWSEQVLAYPSVAASVPNDYATLLRDYLRRPDTVLSAFVN